MHFYGGVEMTKPALKRVLLGGGVLVALWIITSCGMAARDLLKIDACLDMGGRWNNTANCCEK